MLVNLGDKNNIHGSIFLFNKGFQPQLQYKKVLQTLGIRRKSSLAKDLIFTFSSWKKKALRGFISLNPELRQVPAKLSEGKR